MSCFPLVQIEIPYPTAPGCWTLITRRNSCKDTQELHAVIQKGKRDGHTIIQASLAGNSSCIFAFGSLQHYLLVLTLDKRFGYWLLTLVCCLDHCAQHFRQPWGAKASHCLLQVCTCHGPFIQRWCYDHSWLWATNIASLFGTRSIFRYVLFTVVYLYSYVGPIVQERTLSKDIVEAHV